MHNEMRKMCALPGLAKVLFLAPSERILLLGAVPGWRLKINWLVLSNGAAVYKCTEQYYRTIYAFILSIFSARVQHTARDNSLAGCCILGEKEVPLREPVKQDFCLFLCAHTSTSIKTLGGDLTS